MMRTVSAQLRQPVVLIAEDNPDHVFLLRESFAEAGLHVVFHHVESGDRCMAFLRRETPYREVPRPDLILLDIHMPRMDGYEVMEQISADPQLRALRVLALSTSSEAADVNRMYALGCSSYLVKPIDFQGFIELARKLSGYWFDLVIPGSASP